MTAVSKGKIYSVTEEGRQVAKANGFIVKRVKVIDIEDDHLLNAEIINSDNSKGAYIFCLYEEHLESAKEQTMLTKITNIARKLLDADTRDLIKAGFMDECLNITKEGQEAIFAAWLLTAANKKSLADDARAKIAEEEEEDEDE